MAKLTRKFYYNQAGGKKINNFFAYIPKSIADKAGIDENNNIKIKAENGKIIIEKE